MKKSLRIYSLTFFLLFICGTSRAEALLPYWMDNACGTEAEVAGHMMVGIGAAGPACYWVGKPSSGAWLSLKVGSKCMSFFVAYNTKASEVCAQFIKP